MDIQAGTGLQGSVTEAEKRFVEEWESVSDAQNYVIREDRRGDEQFIHVTGHQKFKITTYERILTQDRIRDKQFDPFTNGQFRPIMVPESISVKSNPNALSDEDIARIFVASDVAWEEYMAVIDSASTLRRMIELAENTDLSLKRYRELEAREQAANPMKRITQKDQEQFDKMGPTGSPTSGATPPGPRPMRRA
jgi:hypothetical protein